MRIEQFLSASAQRFPEREAVGADGRRVSYSELDRATSNAAAALVSLGVRRGDRVVIHLDNSIEAVVSLYAALKAGAAIVPLNPTTKSDKLAYVLNDCRPAVLIGDARREQVIAPAIERAASPPVVVLTAFSAECAGGFTRPPASFERLTAFAGAAVSDAPGIDLELAALIYTSGSTGTPKGVTLNHLNMVTALRSITGYLENTPDDVILNVLPLSFDYGLYQVLMAIAAGARVVLERSFAYPTTILDALVRERVTAFPIVPTIAALLLRHDLQSYDFSALRYITNTGAPLPPAHIAALRKALPHVRIYSMYGLTECKRVSFLDPAEIDTRPTSVGKPMDNVEVWVVDEQGRRLDCGIGELVVRGSNVMQGYWNLPEDTERVLAPGLYSGEKVLRTGDLCRLDEDGYIYFISRKDDIIKSRGEKVSPKEVENVLYELQGVREAAVVGVPDPVVGHALKAYVSLDPGVQLSEHDVVKHCSKRLEDFMVPRLVEFSSSLPRTSTGKIDRKQLVAS